MAAEVSIAPVLDHYPGLGPIRRIHPLANAGGFSGSLLWRIEREAGDLCLRRWPREHPSAVQLEFIHNVLALWTFGQSELSCLPVPIWNKKGKSFALHDEHLWELAPWLPGKADFQENPSLRRLGIAMKTVARIHQVSQSQYPPCLFQQSLTLHSRRDQLQRLMAGEANQIAAAVERHASEALQARARGLLSHFRRRAPLAALKLNEASTVNVPLFPVIRDLWHDHVLFTGDEVTGIVDFGAMRVDSAACDVSRLLGSLVGTDREAWEVARHAYNSVRPLSADEWKLAQALDEANVILAGLNWLDWICVQGRSFENYDVIYARLDEMLVRLEESRNPPPA